MAPKRSRLTHREQPRPAEPEDPRGPARRCLHQLFEAQAELRPEAEAVVLGADRLSYGELDRRANQLAHRLLRLGVGPERLVGVFLERSVAGLVALLGIWKAGGAYLPLDPRFPDQRIAFMLDDSEARLVVTAEALAPRLRGIHAASEALILDSSRAEIEQENGGRPPHRPGLPDSLAYLIYTSGSTGRPKGVLVPHRGLAGISAAMLPLLAIGPQSRLLQFASCSFDASILEVLLALPAGAALCLAPPEALAAGPELSDLLAHERVTHAVLYPSVLSVLAPHGLRRLEVIFAGAEACSAEIVDRWGERRRFFNGYGPTEATILSTVTECRPGEGRPAIGRPLPHVTAHVLDPEPVESPAGEAGEASPAGELFLGGSGVARGYWRRPDLTAERFVPDPFAGEPGARLYRTGDKVRRLPDGCLDFLGRLDRQVKIDGVRIELGEIEAVLDGLPGVRGSAVLAEEREGRSGLVAYLLVHGEPPSPAALRDDLGQRLLPAMVPSAFVFLDSWPTMPNGKVDRAALAAAGGGQARREERPAAPRGALEQQLAALWCELLRRDSVGVDEDFFALGGRSLLAGQLASRLRDAFHIDLPLAEIFSHPTIAGLAAAIGRRRGERLRPAPPPIAPVPRGGPLPLSFAQERIWFIHRLAPDNLAYHFQVALYFAGPLDAGIYAAALSEIVRRHEILRTTFPAVAGQPVQLVHPPFAVRLPVIDLAALPAAAAAAAAARLMRSEVRRTFDLACLPLVRWLLLRFSPLRHVLVQVEHHFVHDGWSFAVLLGEMKELYRSLAAGRPSPLAEPPIQYADFAVWQRQWMRGDLLAGLLAFWRQRLAGSPPRLELPVDRPRPKLQTFRGRALQTALPPVLYHGLREHARGTGTTLYMVMLAAFKALLHRYSAQEDLLVGGGVANRRAPQLETMIGMVVNTVVFRTSLGGDPPWRELLERVRRTTLEAQAHEDLPFEKLVEELAPERDPERNPIFQVLFSFHDAAVPDLDLGAVTGRVRVLHNGSAKADLNIVAVPQAEQRFGLPATGEERLELIWEYSSDLFDPVTVERQLSHYENLLAALLAAPGRRLSGLPLLAAPERQQLLREWNDPAVPPAGEPAHRLFERQALRRPEALAAGAGCAVSISYGELNRRANRMAHWLRSQGIGRGDLVGVLAERGLDLLAFLLALYKAAAVYVPLDPRHPDGRLRLALAAGLRLVATGQSLAGRALELAGATAPPAQVFCWDEAPPGLAVAGRGALAGQPETDPPPLAGPRDLANVFFTSGSTGAPKGVMVEHGGVAGHLLAKIELLGLDSRSRVIQNAALGFDISVWQLLAPLAAGGAVLIYDDGAAADLAGFFFRLERDCATVVETVPSLLEAMLAALPVHGGPALSGLTCLISNAETLPVPLARRWLERFARVPLINTYGATECSDDVTHHLQHRAPPEGLLRVPVGRPIEATSVHVLDRGLRLAPLGSPGQLAIAGASLGRGYLGDPARTACSFVPDPFSERAGERLYLSGDLGRWSPQGVLEFLGRLDDQVKVRGHRIELGEIEAALALHPRIHQAAVALRPDGRGKDRLVAYVVAGDALGAGELREQLRATLPRSMMPERIVRLAALPLNRNGKIDRQALPAPAEETEEGCHTAPRDPLESRLAEVWRDVLGVPRVGVHDDFFELGGHSLRALQLVSALESRLGLAVSLEQLFLAPSVSALAARLAAEQPAVRGEILAPPHREPIPRLPDQVSYPLSAAQQWQWVAHHLGGARGTQSPRILQLEGRLDRGALRDALGALIAHHEILRTAFVEIAGEPRQVIDACAAAALPLCDLGALPPPLRQRAAGGVVGQVGSVRHDLAAPPLLRTALVRLGAERHLCLLHLPHLVSDGWSEALLARDLAAWYNARRAGASPRCATPGAAPSIRYVDFAAWQRLRLASSELAAQKAFWLGRFADPPPALRLPAAPPGTSGARLVARSFDAASTARLRQLAHGREATLFMALAAAFAAVLGRWTGCDDIALGSVAAGRTYPQLAEIAGVFLNPLPLRCDLSGDPSLGQLLDRIKRATLLALEHQDYPFHAWLEDLRRTAGRGDLMPCTAWVVYEEEPAALDFAGLSAVLLPSQTAVSHLEPALGAAAEAPAQALILNAVAAGGGLRLAISGPRETGACTVGRLAAQLCRSLEQLSARPEIRLSELDLSAGLEEAGGQTAPPEGALDGELLRLLAAWSAAPPPQTAILTGEGAVLGCAGPELFDPLELARFLAERQAAALVATPEQLASLDEALALALDDGWLPPRRVIAAGGWPAALLPRLAGSSRLAAFLPLGSGGEGLWAGPPAPPARADRGAPFVGRPLPGRQLEIRDHRGWPSPLGVPGEIHLSASGPGRDSRPTGVRGRWLEGGTVEVAAPPARGGGEPAPRRRPGASAYEAPRTPLERSLASAWEEVLEVAEAGREDDFLALGGTAETAVRISTLLARRNLFARAGDILGRRTVAALAETVEERMSLAGAAPPAPPTPLQRAWLRAHRQAPGDTADSIALRASRRLDPHRLALALAALAARHCALRARFAPHGGLWLQETGPAAAVPLAVLDLDRLSPAHAAEQLAAAARHERRQVDPLAGRPLRALLVRQEGAGDLVVLALSRLLVDEPSWHVLASDLGACYAGERPEGAPALPGPRSFHHWLPLGERLAACREPAGETGQEPVLPRADYRTLGPAGCILPGAGLSAFLAAEAAAPLALALVRAYAGATGSSRVHLGLEVDRRRGLPSLPDLTGTVGQFGALRPVEISLGPGEDGEDALCQILAGLSRPGAGHPAPELAGRLDLVFRAATASGPPPAPPFRLALEHTWLAPPLCAPAGRPLMRVVAVGGGEQVGVLVTAPAGQAELAEALLRLYPAAVAALPPPLWQATQGFGGPASIPPSLLAMAELEAVFPEE